MRTLLGNEYLNLGRVIRVRFNKGWKNGREELVAEVEALIKGEVQVFTRYRGADAEALQALPGGQPSGAATPVPVGAAGPMSAPFALNTSRHDTLHDL